MAPSLLGQHQQTVCSGCRFDIVAEVADSSSRFVVCPNCGIRDELNAAHAVEADHVALKAGQLPSRWQVIGFQREGDSQASVKRVVGLPGEAVSFEDGNIFLHDKNGVRNLLRKNWKQQQATRLLVHDNRFQNSNQSSRWLPIDTTDSLIASLPKQFQTDQRQWLRFQPKRCYEHSLNQDWTPRIEDSYGFNQSIKRQLNSVNEVCLDFEFDPSAPSVKAGNMELLVAIVVGQQTLLARFAIKADSVDAQLFGRDGHLTKVTSYQHERDLPICGISNIDQQIIIAVGDRQIQSLELESHDHADSVEVLLSLEPSNADDLKRLRLWRDAYYFSPVSRQELLRRQAGSGTAGTEGYFVVGDNLPVSQDSRIWLRPRVIAKEILGVVDIGR